MGHGALSFGGLTERSITNVMFANLESNYMTNLVLLSIQLVTNDVSKWEYQEVRSSTNSNGVEFNVFGPRVQIHIKEVWQLYTIGYLPYKGPQLDINSGLYFSSNEIPVKMLTLSNMIGTLEPKQETNWVFTHSKL